MTKKEIDNKLLEMIQRHFPSLPLDDRYTDWGKWLAFATAAYEAGRIAGMAQERALQAVSDIGQEIEAIRPPKAGDRVICVEDGDAGTVQWTMANGSPYVAFDSGAYGTYPIKEFGELFRYEDAPLDVDGGCVTLPKPGAYDTVRNIDYFTATQLQQAVAQERERNAGVLRQAREALEELHYASTDKAYAMGTAACVAIDGVLKL